jgi:hypothetical protein
MSKALTVESYEDGLKPMLSKPQDSEFIRQMQISFGLETTGYAEEISASERQVELSYARSIMESADTLDYLLRDSRMSHSIGALCLANCLFCISSTLACTSLSLSLSTGLFYSTLYDMLKSRIEKKRLPVSTGITVKEEEITINPKKLEPDIFYLFYHKNEKYVARRIDRDVVEIYEVTE